MKNDREMMRALLDGKTLQKGEEIAFLGNEVKKTEGRYLAGAFLLGADLTRANLAWAILTNANLVEANLAGANLAHANLAGANLTCAILVGANLRGANLRHAILTGANLSGADLTTALMRNAILRDANLHSAKLPHYLICPEIGSFEAYKKVQSYIVRLLVPHDAKRTASLVGRQCRAEFIDVLEIYGLDPDEIIYSEYDGKTPYKAGCRVCADRHDDDIRVEWTNGIHFFMTREEAENWK